MSEIDPVLADPIRRGAEAERIITSPVWGDVWNRMEASIVDAWKSEKSINPERMAELKRTHMVLTKLRDHFESAMADGRIERANQERTLKERLAGLFGQ